MLSLDDFTTKYAEIRLYNTALQKPYISRKRGVVYRSNNNANANGGISYANANNGSSNANTNIGVRLEIQKKKNIER